MCCVGFLLVALKLSHPAACEILVPRPRIKPMSLHLEGRFLTTGPPLYLPSLAFFNIYIYQQSSFRVPNPFLLIRMFDKSEQIILGFPGGSVGKESTCNTGYLGLIPGSARSPGEGKGNPFQYSCLRILWAEEPGGLQSMRLQRVGHN